MLFSCCTSALSISTSCWRLVFSESTSLDFFSRFSIHCFFRARHREAAALFRSRNRCLFASGSSSSGLRPLLQTVHINHYHWDNGYGLCMCTVPARRQLRSKKVPWRISTTNITALLYMWERERERVSESVCVCVCWWCSQEYQMTETTSFAGKVKKVINIHKLHKTYALMALAVQTKSLLHFVHQSIDV